MALSEAMGSLFNWKAGTIQTYTAGGTVWYGGLVVVKIGDGLVYAAEDDTDDSEKQIVIGYALESKVSGEKIRIRSDGKLKRIIVGTPAVVLGRLALIKDDETVQLYVDGTECTVVVGRIVESVSSTEVFVNLDDRPKRLATSVND